MAFVIYSFTIKSYLSISFILIFLSFNIYLQCNKYAILSIDKVFSYFSYPISFYILGILTIFSIISCFTSDYSLFIISTFYLNLQSKNKCSSVSHFPHNAQLPFYISENKDFNLLPVINFINLSLLKHLSYSIFVELNFKSSLIS